MGDKTYKTYMTYMTYSEDSMIFTTFANNVWVSQLIEINPLNPLL
jgi:hypothetical protein